MVEEVMLCAQVSKNSQQTLLPLWGKNKLLLRHGLQQSTICSALSQKAKIDLAGEEGGITTCVASFIF